MEIKKAQYVSYGWISSKSYFVQCGGAIFTVRYIVQKVRASAFGANRDTERMVDAAYLSVLWGNGDFVDEDFEFHASVEDMLCHNEIDEEMESVRKWYGDKLPNEVYDFIYGTVIGSLFELWVIGNGI